MIMASILFLLGPLKHLNDARQSKALKSSPMCFSNASLSSVATNCSKLFTKASEVMTSSPKTQGHKKVRNLMGSNLTIGNHIAACRQWLLTVASACHV